MLENHAAKESGVFPYTASVRVDAQQTAIVYTVAEDSAGNRTSALEYEIKKSEALA